MMTHAVLTARIAKISLTCAVMSLSMLIAGCATDRLDLAPSSYSTPWTPDGNAGASVGAGNFSVPANPLVAELPQSPAIKSEHLYSLPELIDIAQNQNPDTRIAWQQARQAALAVGMGEAVFLPIISASVIGGYQSTSTPCLMLSAVRRILKPLEVLLFLHWHYSGLSLISGSAAHYLKRPNRLPMRLM